jgi:sugar phosphate isomerase/epimerase
MNPLGIFGWIYSGLTLEEMAKTVSGEGFEYVKLRLREPFIVSPGEKLTVSRVREVKKVLDEYGLKSAPVAGYVNIVDTNPESRESKLRLFEELTEYCQELGTAYIATETGSLHPTEPWADHENNRTEEAWNDMLASLERLRGTAKKNGVTLLLEGYVHNVMGTTELASRVVRDLGSDHLGFVLDPFNYFTPRDLEAQEAAYTRIFEAIAPFSHVAHAKDVMYTDKGIETPKVGAGKANWSLFAGMLKRYKPELPLILEHLKRDEARECRKLVMEAFGG